MLRNSVTKQLSERTGSRGIPPRLRSRAHWGFWGPSSPNETAPPEGGCALSRAHLLPNYAGPTPIAVLRPREWTGTPPTNRLRSLIGKSRLFRLRSQFVTRAHDIPDVAIATTVRYYVPADYPIDKLRPLQFGQQTRPAGASTGTALYKSTDGGVTWREVSGQRPAAALGADVGRGGDEHRRAARVPLGRPATVPLRRWRRHSAKDARRRPVHRKRRLHVRRVGGSEEPPT